MPRKLAPNAAPHPFWYKPLPSPPRDPAKWSALIEAFANHLEARYGKNEVQSWYFEVWNEPNIDFWNGDPKQQTYFDLYDVTAKAIKNVDQKLRIGGPATAQAAWVNDFIAHCLQNKIPFDFVSTHVYGNDSAQDVFGINEKIPRRDMVARAAKKVYDQVKSSARTQYAYYLVRIQRYLHEPAGSHRQRLHGAVARQQYSRMRRPRDCHGVLVLLGCLR